MVYDILSMQHIISHFENDLHNQSLITDAKHPAFSISYVVDANES